MNSILVIIWLLTVRRSGVRPVLHRYCGVYIEFGDEIDRLAEEIPNDLAGFVLDTGHLQYVRLDPVEWLRKYKDRLDYVHFKGIDPKVYEEVMSKHISFKWLKM